MDQPGMIDERPLPARTEASTPFWEGLEAGMIRLARCHSCNTLQFPPDITCCTCGGVASDWEELSGRATLYSWTIAHPPLLPYFAPRAPWPVVAVELEEGVRMVSLLRGVDPAEYEFGMPLRAAYERVADDVTLLVFERAEGEGASVSAE